MNLFYTAVNDQSDKSIYVAQSIINYLSLYQQDNSVKFCIFDYSKNQSTDKIKHWQKKFGYSIVEIDHISPVYQHRKVDTYLTNMILKFKCLLDAYEYINDLKPDFLYGSDCDVFWYAYPHQMYGNYVFPNWPERGTIFDFVFKLKNDNFLTDFLVLLCSLNSLDCKYFKFVSHYIKRDVFTSYPTSDNSLAVVLNILGYEKFNYAHVDVCGTYHYASHIVDYLYKRNVYKKIEKLLIDFKIYEEFIEMFGDISGVMR